MTTRISGITLHASSSGRLCVIHGVGCTWSPFCRYFQTNHAAGPSTRKKKTTLSQKMKP
jgi:hypothetical protein